MLDTLTEVQEAYKDTPESHKLFWDTFTANVNATSYLKRHRDYIEREVYGYGDRPYHWLWKIIVDALPENFSMLEIGVFQGQTLSLTALIAKYADKKAKITGISPLNQTGDVYATHADLDYLKRIRDLHTLLNLPQPLLIRGLSFDPRIQKYAETEGAVDLLYIDGCHDYDVVVDDIVSYAPLVKPGGFLLIDDAGLDLNLPSGMITADFFGLTGVTKALKFIPPDFKEVFSVGHNRVYRRA